MFNVNNAIALFKYKQQKLRVSIKHHLALVFKIKDSINSNILLMSSPFLLHTSKIHVIVYSSNILGSLL